MPTLFPVFIDTLTAECYKCSGPLRKIRLSGHHAGAGAYVGLCEHCDQRTWFDIPSRAERGDDSPNEHESNYLRGLGV